MNWQLSISFAVIFLAGALSVAIPLRRQPIERFKFGGKKMSATTATGFIGFLDKLGQEVAKDTKIALETVLPIIVRDAKLAEPIVDLALPAEGPIYNTVVDAAYVSVQGYAALGVNATPDQIANAVLKQTQSTMLPALEKAGLTSDQATSVMLSYVNAILTILNGPLSGSSAPAQPASGQAAPASSPAPAPAPAAASAVVPTPAPVAAA